MPEPNRVNLHFVSTLFDSMGVLAESSLESDTPLTFEQLDQVRKTYLNWTLHKYLGRALAWLFMKLSFLTTSSLILSF